MMSGVRWPWHHVMIMAMALVPAAAAAQTITEWSTETRTSLSFHVNEAALQRLLPSGWTSAPSVTAANRGANLTVTFIERLLVLDAAGKPVRAGTSRYVVFVAPARNAAGDANTVVVSGVSPEGEGAYGVNLTANVSDVSHAASASAETAGRSEEHWQFATASGERVELQVAYRRSAPVKSHVEARLRSARHPEFTRSYRIDQTADVVRSLSTPDRIETLTFHATGPTFAPLFDGKETLLSVTSLPWYVREISVP